MDYKEKLKSIFEKVYFINISDLARSIGMDPSNLRNYSKGKIYCSEEKYKQITSGLDSFLEILKEEKMSF